MRPTIVPSSRASIVRPCRLFQASGGTWRHRSVASRPLSLYKHHTVWRVGRVNELSFECRAKILKHLLRHRESAKIVPRPGRIEATKDVRNVRHRLIRNLKTGHDVSPSARLALRYFQPQ